MAVGKFSRAYLRLSSTFTSAVDLSADDDIDTFTRVIKSVNICLWLNRREI